MPRRSSRSWLETTVKRLCNSQDVAAGTAVAAVLLAGEAVLCGLIIARVPCESDARDMLSSVSQSAIGVDSCQSADTEIDWVAYMDQVKGFLQVLLRAWSHSVVTTHAGAWQMFLRSSRAQ